MAESGTKEALRIGFLAAAEDAERGYVGGLLVTNRFGRPLEFQCTAPVKANRTQEILYGPTLPAYVMCDVIGRTLIEKSQTRPQIVLVDADELLDIRAAVPTPTARVQRRQTADGNVESVDIERDVTWAGWQFRTHAEFLADAKSLQTLCDQLPDTADLLEPFERVREALRETLQATVVKAA